MSRFADELIAEDEALPPIPAMGVDMAPSEGGRDFNEPHLLSTDPFEYDAPRGDAPDVTATSQDDETPWMCFWCGQRPADPEVSELYCSYACRDADHADNER